MALVKTTLIALVRYHQEKFKKSGPGLVDYLVIGKPFHNQFVSVLKILRNKELLYQCAKLIHAKISASKVSSVLSSHFGKALRDSMERATWIRQKEVR